MLVSVAPDVAADFVTRGGSILLDPNDGLRWEWCTTALTALTAIDEHTARTVLAASRAAILRGFALVQANMTEHLPDFV